MDMSNLKKFATLDVARVIGAMVLVTAGMVMASSEGSLAVAIGGFVVMGLGLLLIPGLIQPRSTSQG
jgi:hypothetical protein